MKFIFNHPELKSVRQQLRNQMTKAELLLWDKIKNNQLNYKFRRQYGIDMFIVDFYCPKLKLVIELDGSPHLGKRNIEYDKSRTGYLESLNIKVIRYWNNKVIENLEGVCSDILKQIEKRKIDLK